MRYVEVTTPKLLAGVMARGFHWL